MAKAEIETPKILTSIVFCVIAFVGVSSAQNKTVNSPAESPAAKTSNKANRRPPAKETASEPFDKTDIKTMAAQCVKLETEAGAIELEMFPETAPETVRNFVNLAATGFFDTTVFSRIVPGFVVQGGNIATREKTTEEIVRRSRRTISDEPNIVKHVRGIVSMARSDAANSATTQFFILVSDAPNLDGKFAAFGRVTAGMEAVDTISKGEVTGDKPVKPVKLIRAAVAPCSSAPPQS